MTMTDAASPGSIQTIAEPDPFSDRLRAIFEAAPVGICTLNFEDRLLNVNPAFCRMFGMSREEMLAQTTATIVFPGDGLPLQRQFHEVLAGRLEAFSAECRFVRRNGDVFWAHGALALVRDRAGQPQYVVATLTDIDESRRIMLEANESVSRFRVMFENSTVGIGLMSLERVIIDSNPALCAMMGYSREELIGSTPALVTYPDHHPASAGQFQKLISGEIGFYNTERRYVRRNGDVFWAHVSMNLVRDPSGKPLYCIGLITDIDAQKRAAERLAAQASEYRRTLEQRVEERTRDLVQANLRLEGEIEQRRRAEEALAARAAEEATLAERTRIARDLHDAVTQTLFSASLIAEVLPALWQFDAEEGRKSAEELHQLTRGALAEMRTLLLELRPAALNHARLPDLIRQLSEAVIGRTRLPVRLDVAGDDALPPDVKVVFYRIAQECLNNIAKYARATQVQIHIRLAAGQARMQIQDNGVGFDPSVIRPTSLGMRIMRERAEAVRARLRISSCPGEGTTVSLDWSEGAAPEDRQSAQGGCA